eukprot:2668339-Lingulodinium_polyedra.AAC.1
MASAVCGAARCAGADLKAVLSRKRAQRAQNCLLTDRLPPQRLTNRTRHTHTTRTPKTGVRLACVTSAVCDPLRRRMVDST